MNEPYQFGLIGYRVSYSRSKQIFETIFEQQKLKGNFTIFDITPEHFELETEKLFQSGVQAASVTIPHKNRIMALLDDIDPVAKALDAVNSVCVRGGHVYGFNTDTYGFAQPLHQYAPQLKHGHAVILGCGGSAKAAVYSLYTDLEVRKFSIISRSWEKLDAFQQSITEILPEASIQIVTLGQSHGTVSDYHILVNCTPLGGWNHPEESPFNPRVPLNRGKLYYDLNYNEKNITIAHAKEMGMVTLNGSEMLVAQAVRSFYLWTGTKIEHAPIYSIVFP